MKLMIKLSSKKQKKYGDIYLNKLFKVSINHLNKSPVILIHIIWFLEEVYKKKSVTLRTLVYDFLKVRKNQQMSPHRVGLFFIATINILSLWNHYVCVHGGIHHSRFFVAKNRIPRRFKATKMSCKKHITDQFSSQRPDPSDGWVLITATMSVEIRGTSQSEQRKQWAIRDPQG